MLGTFGTFTNQWLYIVFIVALIFTVFIVVLIK